MTSNFSNKGSERTLVSERHRFKSPNSPSKLDGEASEGNNPGSDVTTDDEDDSSPPPALVCPTENALKDIMEVSTALRESI